METKSPSLSQQKRLVLCFDGTGNKFTGDESDTNIVKIYEMLDRNTEGQYHYYQPGIGTYVENQNSTSASGGFFSRLRSNVATTVDEAVGTSFVDHVLAGYRFVMRYFSPDDCIYIFGFSRGAYTARFLAEMLNSIGLLSRGNEEMVAFAWTTFSEFQKTRGNDPQTPEDQARLTFMQKFRFAFCRPECNVHFLGLFDCVNSVGQFEIPFSRKSYRYIASPPATHIRHAISIHERRLKFKPALFIYDQEAVAQSDIKEVWFAGNHGDVGGGWPLAKGQKNLLSDTPLAWMIEELLELPHTDNKLTFRKTLVDQTPISETTLADHLATGLTTTKPSNREQRIIGNRPHDLLAWNRGSSWAGTIGWWILEILPFTRLELEHGAWIPRRWPPNMGARRDIPLNAVIHPSVEQMCKVGGLTADEVPKLGGDEPAVMLQAPHARKIWSKLRAAREGSRSGEREALLANGNGHGPSGGGSTSTTQVKTWNNVGTIGSKRWNWD